MLHPLTLSGGTDDGSPGVPRDREPAVLEPFAVHDSAGVEIVVNGSPLWATGSGWTVGPEPALVLTLDPAAGRFLNRVKNIERLADGQEG